jgi:hypothetical protein
MQKARALCATSLRHWQAGVAYLARGSSSSTFLSASLAAILRIFIQVDESADFLHPHSVANRSNVSMPVGVDTTESFTVS